MIQRLFKKINGKIAFWEAEAKDGVLIKRWAKSLNGKVTEREKSYVGKGKQKRNCQEQAEFMLASEVNSHVDDGYVYDIEHTSWDVTNSLGFPIPMLATDSRKIKPGVIDFSLCSLGPKLNGHRMLLGIEACPGKVADPRYKADGQITLYSRGSQKIDLPHILNEILPIVQKRCLDGLPLDGEVYHHGSALQDIKSMVAHKDERLKWHLYDMVSAIPHYLRRSQIDKLIPKNLKHVVHNPSHAVDEAGSRRLHKQYVEAGYEGTILRWSEAGYAQDARPNYLVKQKDFIDEEFSVVGMRLDEPRKDMNGDVLQCPSFQLMNNNRSGDMFWVTVHGDMYAKDKIAKQGLRHWMGRRVTISFQERSKDGIPTICTCLGEREDL